MKRIKIVLLLISFSLSNLLQAQVGIKEDGMAVDSSAQLEIQSLDKGFLMPRMTKDDKLAIPSPSNGLFLFEIDNTPSFQYNSGTPTAAIWERLAKAEAIQIVEARTPLDELNTDALGTVLISKPGSYYLRQDLVISRANADGIRINSDNVTIDLNGYGIISTRSDTDDGISTSGRHNNIIIKNGTISGFGEDGINGIFLAQSTFQNLLIQDNGDEGMVVDLNCLIINCLVTRNGNDGMEVDDGSIIRNCTASFNGDDGIVTSFGCSVYNCTAFSNARDGISASNGTQVIGCTVYDNDVYGIDLALGGMCINNMALRNGEHGLDIASSSLVMNNVSNDNGVCITDTNCPSGGGSGSNTSQGAGIRSFANSFIFNNYCSGNYFGIALSSTDACAIGNNVQNNSHAGILSSSSGCMVINNTAHNNGFAQSPSVTDIDRYGMGDFALRDENASRPAYGPIIDVSGVGDISTISNSDHPFANFVY